MDKQVMSPWMTVEECSGYLRCSLRYMREKVANKEVPFTKFGGKALFNRKRIDAWMLSQEEMSGQATVKIGEESTSSTSIDIDTQILPDCDREKVNALVQQLVDFNEHFVTRLGQNLQRDLAEGEYKELSVKVYAQLSRWCHPNRNSERERKVKPIVHEISTACFGTVIERTKHPSYTG